MNKQVYAISLATALSLGYVGGFTADNILAQTSSDRAASVTVRGSKPTANAAITDLWNKVEAVGCEEADTRIPMDVGTCAAKMEPCSLNSCVTFCCVESTSCVDDDGDPETPDVCTSTPTTTYSIDYSFDGVWVPSAP